MATTRRLHRSWCGATRTDRSWLDLLREGAKADGFDLWAPEPGDEETHELIVRDRYYNTERSARVVWLPCSRDAIGWFKPFELEADEVWEKSLLQALREYGVDISREHEDELMGLLPAHAREWFDKPKETWKELTPGNAKGALVDDLRMMQVLAGPTGEFNRLREEERFDIFSRRATEDFGLPDPNRQSEESWRVAATARLLCTKAADGSPREPPREPDNVIAAGLPRTRALQLLKHWQHDIRYIANFEQLVPQAEATIGLTYWARNLSSMPRSRSSRAVEETLFLQTADRLDRLEEVDVLADELERNIQTFKDRESGFWGREATNCVGWRYLVELADVAALLVENRATEGNWKSVADSVDWYGSRGWRLDQAGEQLFRESADLPKQLQRIRVRLRRGYLRTRDRVGRSFSELLAKDKEKVFELPTAGEVALEELERQNIPTALVFLDACRLDLGQRLAQLLNQGEPAIRATVSTAVAPLPSITALGMAFALPLKRNSLHIGLADDHKSFRVTADGFDGDLKWAEQRRAWLKQNLDVKDWLEIEQVLDGETLKKPSRSRRMIAVHGDLEVIVPRGTNAFRTYGVLGFFHGGATLQEMIIPVVVATWPAKARKVNVVLKPVAHITSEAPRVQAQSAATGQLFNADVNLLSRRVLVKVKDPDTGKVVFKHDDPITIVPEGEPVTVQLAIVEPKPELAYDTPLLIEVLDMDDEEILAREEVTLKIEITDW